MAFWNQPDWDTRLSATMLPSFHTMSPCVMISLRSPVASHQGSRSLKKVVGILSFLKISAGRDIQAKFTMGVARLIAANGKLAIRGPKGPFFQ